MSSAAAIPHNYPSAFTGMPSVWSIDGPFSEKTRYVYEPRREAPEGSIRAEFQKNRGSLFSRFTKSVAQTLSTSLTALKESWKSGQLVAGFKEAASGLLPGFLLSHGARIAVNYGLTSSELAGAGLTFGASTLTAATVKGFYDARRAQQKRVKEGAEPLPFLFNREALRTYGWRGGFTRAFVKEDWKNVGQSIFKSLPLMGGFRAFGDAAINFRNDYNRTREENPQASVSRFQYFRQNWSKYTFKGAVGLGAVAGGYIGLDRVRDAIEAAEAAALAKNAATVSFTENIPLADILAKHSGQNAFVPPAHVPEPPASEISPVIESYTDTPEPPSPEIATHEIQGNNSDHVLTGFAGDDQLADAKLPETPALCEPTFESRFSDLTDQLDQSGVTGRFKEDLKFAERGKPWALLNLAYYAAHGKEGLAQNYEWAWKMAHLAREAGNPDAGKFITDLERVMPVKPQMPSCDVEMPAPPHPAVPAHSTPGRTEIAQAASATHAPQQTAEAARGSFTPAPTSTEDVMPPPLRPDTPPTPTAETLQPPSGYDTPEPPADTSAPAKPDLAQSPANHTPPEYNLADLPPHERVTALMHGVDSSHFSDRLKDDLKFAALGKPWAILNVAFYANNALEGMPHNVELARSLAEAARDAGNPDAIKFLAQLPPAPANDSLTKLALGNTPTPLDQEIWVGGLRGLVRPLDGVPVNETTLAAVARKMLADAPESIRHAAAYGFNQHANDATQLAAVPQGGTAPIPKVQHIAQIPPPAPNSNMAAQNPANLNNQLALAPGFALR